MAKIILASGSPRRHELLTALGIDFEMRPSNIPEQRRDDESPAEYVVRLAREKASFVANDAVASIVIGADTTVVVDGTLLEKPADHNDVRQMLRLLSGKWHDVLTGLCLIQSDSGRIVGGVESTRVLFHPLTDEDIEWYLNTGEPFDKAGAYAIQGNGSLIVDKIEGNYFNIVGVPINLLYRLAHQLGEEVRNWQ